jgi:DNA-binding winged helix-turn-helix (wHTH) protein
VSELYRVGDLLVDVTGASVSRHGERLVLPPRTFELLVALVRRYPCTVRRHDLLDTVWADAHVGDQALSHRVMVLRQALGDHAEEPVYVAGERGFGYRLLAPVERIGEAESLARPDAAPSPPRARRRGEFAATAGISAAVALLALGLVSAWRAGRRRPNAS